MLWVYGDYKYVYSYLLGAIVAMCYWPNLLNSLSAAFSFLHLLFLFEADLNTAAEQCGLDISFYNLQSHNRFFI